MALFPDIAPSFHETCLKTRRDRGDRRDGGVVCVVSEFVVVCSDSAIDVFDASLNFLARFSDDGGRACCGFGANQLLVAVSTGAWRTKLRTLPSGDVVVQHDALKGRGKVWGIDSNCTTTIVGAKHPHGSCVDVFEGSVKVRTVFPDVLRPRGLVLSHSAAHAFITSDHHSVVRTPLQAAATDNAARARSWVRAPINGQSGAVECEDGMLLFVSSVGHVLRKRLSDDGIEFMYEYVFGTGRTGPASIAFGPAVGLAVLQGGELMVFSSAWTRARAAWIGACVQNKRFSDTGN